uniref:Uncharacterized protein n=1 Tax=Cannabis sativa TaxID=3483 RepID=A0A803PCY2_CANSA
MLALASQMNPGQCYSSRMMRMLKNKVRKRSRPINVDLPAQDSSREKFGVVGANKRSPIDISLDEIENGVWNSGLDLVK